MSAPPLVVLPSPLLGPASARPLADALVARGRQAAVAALTAAPATMADALRDYADQIRRQVPDGPVVLVAHSGAGAYAPALTALVEAVGVVLVDAVLAPRDGSVPVVAPSFRSFLAGLPVEEGRLPPWTQWWGEDVGHLFPDEATRRAVEAEQPRLPVGYVDSTLPVPRGWDDLARAYVAFGATYAAEVADATVRGWAVRELDGGHLHLLVDPDAVAGAALDALAAAVSRRVR
jgi:hypothetical protein